MALIQMQKVVAVCLLEATKLTMDQLGKHRMGLADASGVEVGRTLTSLYGDLRRLRDYMQRCLGAHREMVDIDLSPEDQRLVVACCRRSVEQLDMQLSATIDPKTREWLQSRREILADWAVELVTPPLLELPLPRLSTPASAAMRALETRLAERLGQLRSAQVGFTSERSGRFGEMPDFTAARPSGQGSFGMGSESGSKMMLPDSMTAGPMQPMPDPATAVAALPAQEVGSAPARASQLLDPKHVRDPRLRAIATLDLRALDRALMAQDHRLVAVHLASIVEATVIDHAIPRRVELGLPSTVETWDPQEVLLQVLGDSVTSRDRATVHAIFSSRNILRPGVQLVTPTAVTSATVQQMMAFVGRVLSAMGLAAAAQ